MGYLSFRIGLAKMDYHFGFLEWQAKSQAHSLFFRFFAIFLVAMLFLKVALYHPFWFPRLTLSVWVFRQEVQRADHQSQLFSPVYFG